MNHGYRCNHMYADTCIWTEQSFTIHSPVLPHVSDHGFRECPGHGCPLRRIVSFLPLLHCYGLLNRIEVGVGEDKSYSQFCFTHCHLSTRMDLFGLSLTKFFMNLYSLRFKSASSSDKEESQLKHTHLLHDSFFCISPVPYPYNFFSYKHVNHTNR